MQDVTPDRSESLYLPDQKVNMQLTELRRQDPATLTYLGSPSLVRLPDGTLLATHDYFGPGCPRNHENEAHLTSVYRQTTMVSVGAT